MKKFIRLALCLLLLCGCQKAAEPPAAEQPKNDPPAKDSWLSGGTGQMLLSTFKMALEPVEGTVLRGSEALTVRIAFATGYRTGDHWDVTVEAPDLSVDCPEQVWAREEPGSPNWGGTDYEHLPQKFELTLTPAAREGAYSGTVTVTLRHPNQTGTVNLYYYGDRDICCFSQKSIAAAEGIHYLNTQWK